MAELTEVADARDLLRSEWKRHGLPDIGLALLHCVVSYPTPPAEANLRQSRRLQPSVKPLGIPTIRSASKLRHSLLPPARG